MRPRAEALKPPRPGSRPPVEEMQKRVHDLQVHQMELERQNEELRRIQLELQQSRDRFRDLYEFAPAGCLTVNSQGTVLEANLTAANMLGVPRKKLLARSFSRFLEGASRETSSLLRRAVFSSHQPQRCELALRTADGAGLPVHLESLPVAGRAARIRQCRIALFDITGLRRSQAALCEACDKLEEKVSLRTAELDKANAQLEHLLASSRQSEQALADFFAEAPLGLLCVAPDGRILRANQALGAMLGCRGEELIGRRWAETGAEAEVVAAMLERLARKESLHDDPLRFERKNRPLLHVLVDANGWWENGKLVHSRWFIRDVTRRVALEKEILAISDRERQRIGQDLHDDLCPQLTSIEFLNRALERRLQANGRNESAQASEIGQLTRRAMTHARELARGMSPVDPHPDGLTGALQDLAAHTTAIFRIDCRFRGQAPAPVDDRTTQMHLYRIAQEAVRNAVRHGKARQIEIGLKTGQKRTVLSVRDNGGGIPPRLPRSSGLGLRIMDLRASVLGGTVLVRKSRNGGTAVVCSVPEPPAKPSA